MVKATVGRRIGALLVTGALATAGCGAGGPGDGGAAAGEGTTLRVATQQVNFASIPLPLGIDLGLFAAEGLNLETTVGQATATMTAGLLGGSFDIQVGGAELMVAHEEGAPLVAFAGMCNAPVWSLIAKSGIRSMADLRGKVLATSGPDSSSTIALVAALEAAGVPVDSYQQITAGGTAERYSAVQSGQADATIVASPLEFAAGEQGLTVLGSLYDSLPAFVSGFVVTTEQFAQDHRDAVDRFSRAWLRTLRWMHDPANENELVTRVAAILQTPTSQAQAAYDYWLASERSRMFPIDGRIDRDGLAVSAEAFVANGTLRSAPDLDGFVVDDYMERAAEQL